MLLVKQKRPIWYKWNQIFFLQLLKQALFLIQKGSKSVVNECYFSIIRLRMIYRKTSWIKPSDPQQPTPAISK